MAIYGMSSTFGPPLALVISGYIAQDKGWRWLFWVYMAITGGVWVIMLVSVILAALSRFSTRADTTLYS